MAASDARTSAQFELEAKQVLPQKVFDFVMAGAGTERTVAANEAAWHQYEIVPRALGGVASADTSTQILGTSYSAPMVLAPAGRQRALHPDGEIAAASAAERFGTAYCLATSATTDLHDLRSGHRWLQLYVSTDRAWTEGVVGGAASSGYELILVTVDRPTEAHRPRAARHGGLGPLPPGVHVTSHRGDGTTRSDDPGVWDPLIGWDDIRSLRSLTSVPIGVKGILRPDDALRAVDAGASTVVVSNHGGRQIDGAIATARALPAIVSAVNGQVPVLVDGGIRTGGDIFRALALGARATLIGRPYLWALASGGAPAVKALLSQLREELREVMALSGCAALGDITPDLVSRL
ncbi:alpha-hydroxy acid oxidase [Lysobacter korlensis]|uniref:Alpha-hydroxy acid oxidase n=1 Tax=Lysobacter korlensis TaxID=553636 RepID=A0ABV6RPH1_9GAMM